MLEALLYSWYLKSPGMTRDVVVGGGGGEEGGSGEERVY